MTGFLLMAMSGCGDTLFTLPSDVDKPGGPAKIGRTLFRERRHILPGVNSGPPPPEPGITSDQCDQLTDGGPVSGPDCITGTIKCGETLVGHTVGGSNRFNTRFYEQYFCTPAFQDYNGGDERVYRLDIPDGGWRTYVTLDSPCANLDMAGIKWVDDTCPHNKSMVSQCEMFPDNISKTREKIELVSQRATSWLIVVEGRGAEEGAFSLSVQCRPGIR